MKQCKFMYLDRDMGRFVETKNNEIVDAVYEAWNYEYPLYDASTELCIFEPYADDGDNSEMLEEYDIRVIIKDRYRVLQRISTDEIYKAPWHD